MAKLPNYNGSIDLISGLRPKNNGTFPLMEAHDIQVTETQRLDDMFSSPESWLPVYNGENEGATEGGTTGGGGGGNYVLELTGESGTLTDEQYQVVVDNFPNVVVKSGEYYYNGMQLTSTRYIFNVSGVVETAVGTVVTKQIQQSTIVVLRTSPQWVRVDTIVEIPSGGSGGGITKTKVTLAELKALFTAENVGVLVTVIPKAENLPSDIDSSILNCIASASIVTPINNTSGGWGIGYQYFTGLSVGDDSSHTLTTGILIILQEGVLGMGINTDLVTPIDFTTYITDEYFDFYIYK